MFNDTRGSLILDCNDNDGNMEIFRVTDARGGRFTMYADGSCQFNYKYDLVLSVHTLKDFSFGGKSPSKINISDKAGKCLLKYEDGELTFDGISDERCKEFFRLLTGHNDWGGYTHD
jgi:hypothetical protein